MRRSTEETGNSKEAGGTGKTKGNAKSTGKAKAILKAKHPRNKMLLPISEILTSNL